MAGKTRRIQLEGRKMPVGLEGSGTRAVLLDAAERLMGEEGYAAVTTRRLGAAADIRPQLVHYYFPSMDELFIALFRRRRALHLARAQAALDADEPLRAIWSINLDPAAVVFSYEFTALANHRKALRAEIAEFTEAVRALHLQAIVRYFERRGVEPAIAPGAMMLSLTGVAQQLARETMLGVSFAHAETEAWIETILEQFQQGRPAS